MGRTRSTQEKQNKTEKEARKCPTRSRCWKQKKWTRVRERMEEDVGTLQAVIQVCGKSRRVHFVGHLMFTLEHLPHVLFCSPPFFSFAFLPDVSPWMFLFPSSLLCSHCPFLAWLGGRYSDKITVLPSSTSSPLCDSLYSSCWTGGKLADPWRPPSGPC